MIFGVGAIKVASLGVILRILREELDMSQSVISLNRFLEILPSVCSAETAAGQGAGWTPENPLWGHCAVASLLVQRLFGGKLLRVDLNGTAFSAMRSHYYNELPTGNLVDATEPQFEGRLNPFAIRCEERDRESVIAGADTRARYAKLAVKFMVAAFEENPLFQDGLYRQCLREAYLSPCQKAGFGAVLRHESGLEYEWDHNRPTDALADMCQPTCIRLGKQSRTESMLGACGHAEEWVMSKAIRRGLPLPECDLYVAGITADGLPWLKTEASHTCIRCSHQMHIYGIRAVYVPTEDGKWSKLSTAAALADAKLYALGKKKV